MNSICELRCPKCGNNYLSYVCNPDVEKEKKYAKENKGQRYRLNNNVLEHYFEGTWRETYQYHPPSGPPYGNGIFHYYFFCKCGFYSRDEDVFVYDINNDFYENPIETISYANGRKYVGQMSDEKREGYGIMYYPGGGRYEGDYKNDEEHGQGVMYYSNGDRMMGNYANGDPIGVHVKLHANGKVEIINY